MNKKYDETPLEKPLYLRRAKAVKKRNIQDEAISTELTDFDGENLFTFSQNFSKEQIEEILIFANKTYRTGLLWGLKTGSEETMEAMENRRPVI